MDLLLLMTVILVLWYAGVLLVMVLTRRAVEQLLVLERRRRTADAELERTVEDRYTGGTRCIDRVVEVVVRLLALDRPVEELTGTAATAVIRHLNR